MDVKVIGHDSSIPSGTVENVMKALHSIARGIAKAEYNQDSPESDSLKQILLSARSPDSVTVNKDAVIAMFGVKHPVGNKVKRYMSGSEICDTLFEDGWKNKIKSENPIENISLKNDEVRAIIKAANPKIAVTFNMPLNMEDRTTKVYEASVKRTEGNRRNDLEITHWNDPDLYLGAIDTVNYQSEKERGWRAYITSETAGRYK